MSDATERFQPGDIVIDRDQLKAGAEADSLNPLYVLAVSEVQADSWEVGDTGRTVADYNLDYPAADTVVRCVFESGLDEAYGSAWRRHIRGDLATWVQDARSRTGTSPRTYDYPASRLVHARPEIKIVPGDNPTDDDLERLERRLARFFGDVEVSP